MIRVAQKVFLSSKNEEYQINGSKKSSFRFPFNARFRDNPTLSHVAVKLTQAEIPISFYLIDSNVGYNTVSVNGVDYTIPDGNYTATELLAWWASTITVAQSVVLAFASKTGLLTFTGTNFTLSATAFRVLGLAEGVSYSVSSSLTAPNLADLYGTRRLHVAIPNLVLNNQNSDIGIGSVLCSVQKDVSAFQVINYRDESGSETLVLGDVRNMPSYLDVEIHGESGLIDFNGVDLYMTLEFVFYFDERLATKRNNLFSFVQDVEEK